MKQSEKICNKRESSTESTDFEDQVNHTNKTDHKASFYGDKLLKKMKSRKEISNTLLKMIVWFAISLTAVKFLLTFEYQITLKGLWFFISVVIFSYLFPVIIRALQFSYWKKKIDEFMQDFDANYQSKSLRVIINTKLLKFKNLDSNSRIRLVSNKFKQIKFMSLIYFFISPDYLTAKHLKEYCSRITSAPIEKEYISLNKKSKLLVFLEKEIRKIIILSSNRINLIIAIILFAIGSLITSDSTYVNVLLLFIFFRIIHRSFEVIPAFYKDVVNKNIYPSGNYYKSSNLKKGHRIYLGVNTIIELTLLNGIFYSLLPMLTMDNELNYNFFSNLFTSVSISQISFVDFTDKDNINLIYQLFHVLQSTVTLVIIVFSIAYYMGNKDEYTWYELKHIKFKNDKEIF